jgi:hypothetical protein
MNLAALYDDPVNLTKLSTSELFDIDYGYVAKCQLHHFRRRFHELRSRIAALRFLTEDIQQEDITSFDDLSNVAFPHTIYKSYSPSDIEHGRYDRITKWFQSFTAHDLSKVDVKSCDNLDVWLERIEAQTLLRPGVTSGTSGKISIIPRSTQELPYFLECVVRMLDPYKEEHMVDFRSGKVPFFNAYPASTGRPGMLIIMRLLREHVYSGRNDMTITLRDHFIGGQELWLSAKLRRAERLGQKPELTAREEELKKLIGLTPEQNEALWDRFVERIVLAQKGRTVLFLGAWIQVYQLAKACKTRGVKIEWARESVIFTGGGTKGYVFPDGWMDTVKDTFASFYPNCFREGYSMSETTSSMICCSAEGHMHPIPWGVQLVADPETGRALPRKGIQKGRLLVFDLLPDTYWAGTATGDEVTANWDGGCSCGRKGPYFYNDVRRLPDSRGGDKVICPKDPRAFERLERYLSEPPQ